MKRLTFLGACLSAFIFQIALAVSSPVAVLENVSDQMLVKLKAHQGVLKDQPELVDGFVRDLFLPVVDVEAMSRLVIGKNAWQAASPEDHQAFKTAFQDMVITTYAKALANYRDQSIRYLPLSEAHENSRFVKVGCLILQHGGPDIKINFHLTQRGGVWKVYDFDVDGISMVRSYRAQFKDILATSGMPGVLASLAKHNARSKS